MNSYNLDLPLQDILLDWKETNLRLHSAQTVSLMKTSLKHFETWLCRPPLLADFTEGNIAEYIRYRHAVGRSPRTVEREASKLCTLWRWAGKRGWCERPMVSVTKCKPATPTAYTTEEWDRVLQAAENYETPLRGHHGFAGRKTELPGWLVMSALIKMLFETGERFGATLQVRWSDIDLRRRIVTFRSATRKGGVKADDNVQRISRKTLWLLNQLRPLCAQLPREALQEDFVFPQMDRTAYYKHLQRVLQVAGMPYDRRCSFHKIRRTHATHLYINGGDPTQSLGHESDAMTRAYYLDKSQIVTRHASDLLTVGLLRRWWRKLKLAARG
jgi:integrase